MSVCLCCTLSTCPNKLITGLARLASFRFFQLPLFLCSQTWLTVILALPFLLIVQNERGSFINSTINGCRRLPMNFHLFSAGRKIYPEKIQIAAAESVAIEIRRL